eukprot:MONOS_9603.1-p1 / transcript=MONOS_9603.1 / gene=MONOS_9603 / organism=Monocercomonoides_exilis_PA203 / gene_product=unspecified product / transcript_product=unspecified product / location=Mono_scaffold00402:28898-30159(+) / protein_length=401 / sequence_SO=supercontig / SO=protein_coding / is_pseudo=false
MNGLMEEMDKEELKSVFTKELFNNILKMIEEEKLMMGNAILLLKHMGYCNMLLNMMCLSFFYSSLKRRFEKMVAEEDEKKEGKDEKLITDLSECILLFGGLTSMELSSIFVPCLLKVALKKEENEETQKEVEIALLAFSCIQLYCNIKRDLFLNEIKEIIQYHEKHHNLTRLAFQSVWQFLIILSFSTNYIVDVIMDEMNFVRETKRELEELTKCVDWKREKEEEIKGKGRKDELVLKRWLRIFEPFFAQCGLWNKECSGIIESIVQVFLVSRDFDSDIGKECIRLFEAAAENRVVKLDSLLKSGAIDAALEEIPKSTIKGKMTYYCLKFFIGISRRLKIKEIDEMEKAKRKTIKMEIFDKLEEEGYEDVIISFRGIFGFLSENFLKRLSLNISDYFVNT